MWGLAARIFEEWLQLNFCSCVDTWRAMFPDTFTSSGICPFSRAQHLTWDRLSPESLAGFAPCSSLVETNHAQAYWIPTVVRNANDRETHPSSPLPSFARILNGTTAIANKGHFPSALYEYCWTSIKNPSYAFSLSLSLSRHISQNNFFSFVPTFFTFFFTSLFFIHIHIIFILLSNFDEFS